MKFFIKTYGCRANQAETCELARSLILRGDTLTDNLKDAEYLIINSCTVTHRADKECRKFISHVKKVNPEIKIIATGCYVERKSEDFHAKGVDFIFKNCEKEKIINLFYDFKVNLLPADSSSFNVRPFLKIQDGCNFKCSYCIIPHVRGKSRSADFEKVVERIENLSRKHAEIVLKGINLGSFGKEYGKSLYHLLSRIKEKKIDIKIRLSSIEPMEFDFRILEFLNENILQPHFHIPLQSGSEKILKSMKRPYSKEKFRKIIENIYKFSGHISIGTDIICGFPGEDEKDFQESFHFLESLPLSYLHIFSFSPRENTPAYSLKNRVKPEEIKRRSKILHDLDKKMKEKFLKRCKGKKLNGIVIKREKDSVKVLTENYIYINIKNSTLKEGEKTQVII